MTQPSYSLVPTHGDAAVRVMSALGATPTAVSLDIENVDMPFNDWENLGRQIGFVASAWQWWIGDWLNFGEMSFGDDKAASAVDDRPTRYDVARRITNLEQTTLQNYRSICAKVPKRLRRAELNFAAHTAVAALEHDDQETWLAKAVEHQWGREDIRAAMKAAKTPTDDAAPVPDLDPTPDLSFHERVMICLRNVKTVAQSLPDGGWWIPADQMAQVDAILAIDTK